ncbi:MAG TPA: DUF3300 domain-containing protein [Xanthobacteraceae bacterium]
MPARTTFLLTTAAFATAFVLLAAPWSAPSAVAQGAPPDQQQPAAQPLSTEQLDQLVAPIALYPDNLLGQILTASTYPLEAVMAARWSAANPNVKGPQLEAAMQQQPWDPSIKALAAVPQVLAMMSDKLDWTQQLGDAYLSQPDDIAAAVQRLRLKAQATGSLQASSQQRVRRVPAPQPIIIDGRPEPDYIVIEPVDPAVLYVPIYDPYVVYGPWAYPAYRPFFWYPPGYAAVGVIGFGAPFVVGAALWAHYNWESRHVDINVANFNRFNHTNLSAASLTWQHDPNHRGNIPYSNAALQTKFSKTGTGTPNPAATIKTNINPTISNPKTGTPTLNNNAVTNLNKNGALNNNAVTNPNKNGALNNGNAKLHDNIHLNTPNTTGTKTFEHHEDAHTDTHVNTRVNTNAVIQNNAVGRSAGGGGGGGGGGNVVHNAVQGGGGNPKDKKKP